MTSAWFGLNTAVSALESAQTMLDTAAHNVANANTPGYSRQRVDLVASDPFTYPAFNRSGLPGQIGTGVSVASVTRVRDTFLDLQIGAQTALQGQWDTRRDELAKVESVFPEPNGSGLGSVLGQFWNAWQDVAADPTSSAARSALVEQASTLAARFNRDAGQITSLQSGADYQVGQAITQINDLATRIASLNDQIQRVQVSGDHPNDLMDQRDQLLDQLNAIVPVTQDPQPDGTVSVLIGGTDLVSKDMVRTIVGAKDPTSGFIVPTWSSGGAVNLGTGTLSALVEQRDVKLPGYLSQLNGLARQVADAVNAIHSQGVDSTGQAGLAFFDYRPGSEASTIAVNATIAGDTRRLAVASPSAGSPPAVPPPGDGSNAGRIADLRNFKSSILGGSTLTDLVVGDALATNGTATVASITLAGATPQTYTFTSGGAGSITLTGADGTSQTLSIADMAAGTSQSLSFAKLGISVTFTAGAGGKAAVDLITDLTTAGNSTIVATAGSSTASDAYASLVGRIGADSRQASEMATNQELVVDHLTQRRDSISGVSLDEEATDMLRFQHAYQAAARVITTMDEMLDQLVNRTGLVGR